MSTSKTVTTSERDRDYAEHLLLPEEEQTGIYDPLTVGALHHHIDSIQMHTELQDVGIDDFEVTVVHGEGDSEIPELDRVEGIVVKGVYVSLETKQVRVII